MNALFLVLVVLSGFVPACYVAATLPALWLIQHPFLEANAILISVAGIEVTLVDGVIVILLAKLLHSIVVTREIALDRPLYLSLGAFFVVNFLATLIAAVKFGAGAMPGGLIALTRLGSEVAILPILAQTITTPVQARRCVRIVLGTLLVLGVIQFVNFVGARHGFAIGEVQGIERGEVRYFGPVGDAVGFILLLGYIFALCSARPLGVLLFGGGIVLTAGLGAIFATGVATLLVLAFGVEARVFRAFARRWLWVVPVLVLGVGLFAATVGRPMAGTLLDRITTGHFHSSGGQRMASAVLSGKMIADNPLSGVGFMGFAAALERYGGERYFDLTKLDGGTANANIQWLQVLTDSGLFGLLTFIAVVTSAVALFHRVSTRCDDALLRIFFRASGLWLLAQVFGNLVAVWMVPSSYVARFLWVLLGIAVAVGRMASNPRRGNEITEGDEASVDGALRAP